MNIHRVLAVCASITLVAATPAAAQLGRSVTPPVVAQAQMEQILDDLQRRAGLLPHISIRPLGDILARARMFGEKRLINYGDSLTDLVDQSNAVVAILAHEVGHHVAGHPQQRERTLQQEIEADYFAGHLLAAYGASLHEAQSGVRAILSPQNTAMRPRSTAVALGWCAAHYLNDSASAAFRPIPKSCASIEYVEPLPPAMKLPPTITSVSDRVMPNSPTERP